MIPPIPLPPGAAAAGVKAAGNMVSAAIGRYHPAGVPRTGSREDRATAYRRLLDASTRAFAYTYMNNHMKREAGWAAYGYLKGQMPLGWEISAELIGALHGVRLCGTLPVIDAAEDTVSTASDMNFGEKDGAVFQKAADAFVVAQKAFLDACREDLGHNAKPWQLLRRRSEKKFLRSLESRTAATPAEIEA
jgi:hypothetical protein